MKRNKPDILLVLAVVIGFGILGSELSLAFDKDSSNSPAPQTSQAVQTTQASLIK